MTVTTLSDHIELKWLEMGFPIAQVASRVGGKEATVRRREADWGRPKETENKVLAEFLATTLDPAAP